MKLEPVQLSSAYLVGFIFAFVGLVSNIGMFMAFGVLFLVWAYFSDDDPNNHVDPPGTSYMDRNGEPL